MLRSRDIVEFLGLWEKLHNPNFKRVEFDTFKIDAGTNAFVFSIKDWTEQLGPFVGDIISRHSKHRKPEKPIQKGRIWQSNDGSLPILTLAVRLVEKQEQEELEEEEALQRAIEAVLAQNKRDYRQDIKIGRI